MPAALSPSPFKLAIFGRWRALALGIAALVTIQLTAGVVLLQTGLLLRPPTSVVLNLKDGQREVSLEQSLNFTFSRPVALDRVEASTRVEPPIDGSFKNAGTDRRHFSWAPTGPWADLTTYTVAMLPLKDADGIAIAKRLWHFTTTIVPRVTGLLTEAGSTTSDGSELPLGSGLTLTFNTAMAATTVSVLVNSTAAVLTWADDGKEASFSTKGIPAGTLDIALGPGAQDRLKHAVQTAWKLQLNLVFAVTEHTVPLSAPAIVQIPNDNYGARDQSGLQAASIIYEYLTEGGITRMSAVFMNAPDVVGPIRSGRLISFKITRHYHGINYFSGLSAGSFAVLTQTPGVPALFDTQGIYYRSPDRSAPNNLYIKGASIKAYEDKTVPPAPLQTGVTQSLTGADATTVTVPEHNSTYTYDATTGTYVKSEDGKPMNDALINQPVRIQLLVVMHAREFLTNIVEDVGGGHGRDFDMESGGAAQFYFHGKVQAGHWSAADAGSPFVFQLDSGQTLSLPKNLVWVDAVSA